MAVKKQLSLRTCSNNMPPTCNRSQGESSPLHSKNPTHPPTHPPPYLISPGEREKSLLIFSVSFFPFLANTRWFFFCNIFFFANLWQASLSQDLVHLKTCGKPWGMFQMIPRCGPQTGLTHSSLDRWPRWSREDALPGESLSNIAQLLSFSVNFCYFQSIRAHWTVA